MSVEARPGEKTLNLHQFESPGLESDQENIAPEISYTVDDLELHDSRMQELVPSSGWFTTKTTTRTSRYRTIALNLFEKFVRRLHSIFQKKQKNRQN